MINLIPSEAQSLVRREYLMRVYTVWALLFAGAILVGATLLIPTFVLFSKQVLIDEDIKIENATTDADYTKTVEELKRATMLADRLSTVGSTVLASDIVAHVEGARSEHVSLENLSITYEKKVSRIEVRGIAETREALSLFLETIKRDAFFLDAQVPVSDLARDTKLPFTATLTLRMTP